MFVGQFINVWIIIVGEELDLDCFKMFQESHKAWQHQEYQYAKALLFLFSVCHIMVVRFVN